MHRKLRTETIVWHKKLIGKPRVKTVPRRGSSCEGGRGSLLGWGFSGVSVAPLGESATPDVTPCVYCRSLSPGEPGLSDEMLRDFGPPGGKQKKHECNSLYDLEQSRLWKKRPPFRCHISGCWPPSPGVVGRTCFWFCPALGGSLWRCRAV